MNVRNNGFVPAAVLLRPAEVVDVDGMVQCVQMAYQHFVARIGQPPAPMLDDYARLIHERMVFVAMAASTVAGVLVLRETDEGFLLDNVAVHPTYQRQGIGKMLLDHAEQCALAAGHDSIFLYTNELMVENRYLYARIGYREYDRRTEQGLSRIYMRKHLVAV
ncbi:Acetyltransferase (GNAT) domain-containing protein [Halopseudomonas xinjiangensis]|uniref:Acetyltransferase (GNAT) domain-containing protein n=1 Tax=Halopseudomonas xinjiangensis TaxID=487184 RepID=A0A1H1VL21_9GAMM|nr:Acetyltransferase (GNAT) domain-containing protein [Halopseudomonas xinjiangensis]